MNQSNRKDWFKIIYKQDFFDNMSIEEEICKEIIKNISEDKIKSRKEVHKIKKQLCMKYKLKHMITNPDILKFATDEQIEKISDIMHIKPTRTISGVAIITVVCKPGPCGGSCTYCLPATKITPKSYSPLEPAVQRAIRNQFDPIRQIADRLNQYRIMGHPSDKIEVIVIGGTFLALEKNYQEWFIKGIYDGLNKFQSKTLEEAIKNNENAKHRCIGLTIETRPDYCLESHVDEMLIYGATRIELGIQSIYNDVLSKTDRGHGVEKSIEALRIAKDAGYKIVAHIMPFLPGSDFKRELEMFKVLFNDPNFIPDDYKIYPTMVMPNTILHEQWKGGEYEPPTDDDVKKLFVEIKKIVPPFVRFRRMLRDMPSTEIASGPKKSNIRELALEELKKQGFRCRCTRCREPGHAKRLYGIEPDIENIKLVRRDYNASEGKEIFLSFEDTKKDILISLVRLRIPSEKAHRKEITEKPSSIIREIHTYGPLVPIDKEPKKEWQHRGYGKELVAEAEKISKEEFDKKKLVIISGVGVKKYFFKLGYSYDGPYVSKILN